jgi:cell division protein FtsW (lipid II flippase)
VKKDPRKTDGLPGETLLKLAAAVFDRDTVTRILTPALSDMQQEWIEAVRAGKRQEAAAARARGTWDFVRTALAIAAIHGAGRLRRLPPALVLGPIGLAGLGVFWIRSASHFGGDPAVAGGAPPAFHKMQAAYLAAGVVFMAITALVPIRRLATAPFRWALVGAASLGATLAFGVELEGARRWVSLAGLNVLPGELAKPLFLVAVAGCLAGSKRGRTAAVSALAIGALFAIPIALQPDPALAAVLLISLSVMGIAAGGPAIQRAAIALPSAGLAAIGLLSGRGSPIGAPPLGDRHTDFIGRVILEEAGIAGVIVAAALMGLTLASMRSAANRGGDRLAQVLAAGASAMWISQAAIHLGSAVGALPRTGIALPLLSYGGSSVIAFFITLGLLAGASIPPRPAQALPAPEPGDQAVE